MEKFNFKKKYGQNFINNNKIINNIIDNSNIFDDTLIIEIGPGAGSLTSALKQFNQPIIAFEIDQETEKFLNKLEDENTKIIYEDFLSSNIIKHLSNYDYRNISIIANLPYYITTPIVEKIISLNLPINEIIIMVQKEVGERFSAKPGNKEYGSVTAYLQYYFDINILFMVDRKNFKPMPNVDSCVIKLKPRNKKITLLNEEHFFKLIKDSFKFKRKTLKNNLSNSYDFELIKKVLQENNMPDNVRAENISVELFAKISNILVK